VDLDSIDACTFQASSYFAENSILWNGHSVQTYAYDLESTQRVSCHRYLNSSYLKNNDSPIQVMSRPDRLDIDLNLIAMPHEDVRKQVFHSSVSELMSIEAPMQIFI
jgi:hypothetical protein